MGDGPLKGLTYFRRWDFSINEGEYPNVHMSWRDGFYGYLALSSRLKWLCTIKLTFARLP